MAIFLPDAEDLRSEDIQPAGPLRDSSPDLGDRSTLDARYEADGYLFFRGLLDRAAVEHARLRMAAPLVERGLLSSLSPDAMWIGGDKPSLDEEEPAFQGVFQELFDWPGMAAAFEKVLGEPACTVPMVTYRAYKPGGGMSGVHQDGFFSPGIAGYRPVWIPLTKIDAALGGLIVAAGLTRHGFFHNLAKAPRSPIPAGVIPNDAWRWSPYEPGDLVVIHPYSPHVGLPNRSDRVRFSIDTRVQSATNPCTISGDLVHFDTRSATLRCDDGSLRTLRLDDETFIRTGAQLNVRMSREEFVSQTQRGLRVLASREGDRALMLRRLTAG